MARFYANENFPRQVVDALRQLGHDVLTILETGKAGISWPDEEVLAFAVAEQRVLITLNRKHFRILHAVNQITAASWPARLIWTTTARLRESTKQSATHTIAEEN